MTNQDGSALAEGADPWAIGTGESPGWQLNFIVYRRLTMMLG